MKEYILVLISALYSTSGTVVTETAGSTITNAATFQSTGDMTIGAAVTVSGGALMTGLWVQISDFKKDFETLRVENDRSTNFSRSFSRNNGSTFENPWE